ncbi:MAG: sugar ABC transporter permease [Clostridia bacterium]|nr:sugar ABC transporter permease [Clostridia bacterium]
MNEYYMIAPKEKGSQKFAKGVKSVCKKLYASKKAYLFLLPLFFFLLTFSYFPAISGIYHSFFDWKDSGEATFIGIENYKELFSDAVVFWPSCITLLKIMLPKLIINIVVPFVVAEMIFNLKSDKAKSNYRLWILIPMVAPGVVTTLIWDYIYDPNFGAITAIWKLFGGEPIDWLNDTRTAIPAIIFMGFPWIGGTNVLIYISGLNSISAEARESARLDGAGTFRIIFSIDLPMIFGQVKFFLINGLISGIQDYSVQFLLTNGGPGYDTMVPGYYMYQAAFQSGRMGYASAIGTFLFVIIMGLTLISFRLGKKKEVDA